MITCVCLTSSTNCGIDPKPTLSIQSSIFFDWLMREGGGRDRRKALIHSQLSRFTGWDRASWKHHSAAKADVWHFWLFGTSWLSEYLPTETSKMRCKTFNSPVQRQSCTAQVWDLGAGAWSIFMLLMSNILSYSELGPEEVLLSAGKHSSLSLIQDHSLVSCKACQWGWPSVEDLSQHGDATSSQNLAALCIAWAQMSDEQWKHYIYVPCSPMKKPQNLAGCPYHGPGGCKKSIPGSMFLLLFSLRCTFQLEQSHSPSSMVAPAAWWQL